MKHKILTTQIVAICIAFISTSFNFANADDTLHWTPDRDVWDFQLAYDDQRHSYKPYYGRVNEATGVINGCHLQKDESTNRLYSLSIEKYTTIDVNNRIGMYTKIWDSGWTEACRYSMAGVGSQVGHIWGGQTSTPGTISTGGIEPIETTINKNRLVSNIVHSQSNKPAQGNTKGNNANTKLYSKMHRDTVANNNQPLQVSKSINPLMHAGIVVDHPGLQFPGLGRETIPPIPNQPIHVSMMGPKFTEQGLYRATLYVHNLDTNQVTPYPTTFSTRNVTVALLGDSFASGEGNPDNPAEWESGVSRILTNPERLFSPSEYIDQCEFVKVFNGSLTSALSKDIDPVEVVANGGESAYSPFKKMQNTPDWLDLSAHRSLKSGHSLAALDFSSWLNRKYGYTTSFYNFSSSGAEIKHLTDKPQYYFHRQKFNVPKKNNCTVCGQIDELAQAVGDDKIDVLIISIGGNDVGFSKAIKSAIKDSIYTNNHSYTQNDFDERLNSLEGSFSRLKNKIDALNVDQVILTGYPVDVFSKSINETNASCGIFETNFEFTGLMSDVSDKEANDLKRWGTDMNAELSRLAEENEWRYVDVSDEFLGHGYCGSETTYFRGAEKSCEMQGDILGSLHPNDKGHEVYRSKVLAELKSYYSNRISKSNAHMKNPLSSMGK